MHRARITSQKSKWLRYAKTYLPFWRRKRVGFYGYFGHGDIGDDAAFIAAQDFLTEDLAPLSKRCYAFNPAWLKGFLIGGGAVLKGDCPYIPRRLLRKNKWNFPVILFSAGVGCDYYQDFTSQAIEKIRALCERCDYLTVRDMISQRFLNGLGFDKVAILPHLELILKDKPTSINLSREDMKIGIVLTSHPEFEPQVFEKLIDTFSQFNNYLTNKGYSIVYLPFENSSTENRTEQEIIGEILKHSQQRDRITVLSNNLEPAEMLFIIKNFVNIMVCMRLHSAVFSVNAGIPFLSLSYNLMHKGFLDMLESPDLEVSILNNFSLNKLIDGFDYIFTNREVIQNKLKQKKEVLRNMADQQFSFINKML